MAYEMYNALLSVKPSTNKAHYRNSYQKLIDSQFANAPNVETIQKWNKTSETFDDITVRLIQAFEIDNDDRKASDDMVTIEFQNMDETGIYIGDVYRFKGYDWIAVETKSIASLVVSCLVRRCNCTLKFTIASPISENVISISGFSEFYVRDVVAEPYKIVPHATMKVTVPYDSNTQSIRYDTKKGTRFLLGDPISAWNVYNIDSISNVRYDTDGNLTDGMLVLYLNQTQKEPKDDLVNKVAWQPWF